MFLLVDMYTPEKVFEEVKNILTIVHPAFDPSMIRKIFEDMVKLFTGKYKSFKRCNTEYHDLKHTTDVFLAITRLVHGYIIAGKTIDEKDIEKALISALMHDTGYIQNELDDEGTGAKYASVHVERSIETASLLTSRAVRG